MGPAKIMFLIFATGVAVVCGASMIDNLNDDKILELREMAGIGILCFVFFGCVATMLLFSTSDVICAFMEHQGDRLLYSGNMLGARRWYDRCLWIQDHLLNNVWRRTQIAGKHVATFRTDDDQADSTEFKLPPGEADIQKNKFVVPPAVANSIIYKYAFAILFALISMVHALDGSPTSAVAILLVGVILNAYWLTTASKE